MTQNFNLSPEDQILWRQRAPRASYWLGVSNAHPFINSGQPIPGLGVTPSLPSYPMMQPPVPATPTLPPYLANGPPIPGIPGMVHPGPVAPFFPGIPVPIYDVCHQNGAHHEDNVPRENHVGHENNVARATPEAPSHFPTRKSNLLS